MAKPMIFPVGSSPASVYAAEILQKYPVLLTDHPTPEATHLLLDIPSFNSEGHMRNGKPIERLLETLPQYITVIGGSLDHPALDGYKTVDFLKDPHYLALNAAITAECALQVAAPMLKTTFRDIPVLILGWGRIGKYLGRLLRHLGAHVTVYARNPDDRAILRTLGYSATEDPASNHDYQVLFNTVPVLLLDHNRLAAYKNCIKIDLASRKGLDGEDVVWARGLPGIYAPESSGRLIADTVLRYLEVKQ